jgi:PKHD-type hydroxylase
MMVNQLYWMWQGIIDKDFCDYVLNGVDWEAEVEEGRINGTNNNNQEIRKTDVVWRNPLHPVGTVMQSYIRAANKLAGWNYELTEYEMVQLGRYTEGGHYDWHKDTLQPDANNLQRKLSAVLLLNAPAEFEGGELELKDADQSKLLSTRGSVIVFPSFLEHRVTPLLSGERYSATCWAIGPAFK